MVRTEQQISRLDIQGYKSIKSCSIDLNMINVLIGSNGSGKSNFVSVFKLLQSIINRELQMHIATGGGADTFLYKGAKETEVIDIIYWFGHNAYRFLLAPTESDTLIFDNEYFIYYKNENDAPFQATLGRAHLESNWEKGSSYPNINEYVTRVLSNQTWRVYHFHDTGKNANVKKTHSVSNCHSLTYDAGNLAAFLLRLKNDFKTHYDNIVNTIRLIAPYFSNFVLDSLNDKGDIVLRWRQVGSDDVFNANQFSDGTLRFICLATLLLQPVCLMPQTIIIDEPELGLHPHAITIFAELVKKVSDKRQIIVSTQSVELLNEFEPNDVIVVERNDDGSVFKRLSESKLRDWLDNDYSLGELWKKNILGGRLSK